MIIIILHGFLCILKTTQIAQSDVELDGFIVITVIGDRRGGLIPKQFNCKDVYVDIAGVCLHLPSLASGGGVRSPKENTVKRVKRILE